MGSPVLHSEQVPEREDEDNEEEEEQNEAPCSTCIRRRENERHDQG